MTEEHVHPEIEELAAGMFGPRNTALAGAGRNEEEGLVYKVDALGAGQDRNAESMARIEVALANGTSTSLQLSGGQKALAAIVVTILASIAVPLLVFALGGA